jgi:hypothetical protein
VRRVDGALDPEDDERFPTDTWIVQAIPRQDVRLRCLLAPPRDQLAARLAREGESEPIHIEEADTTFAIGWKGRYRIEGLAFVYSDDDTGRVATILGYPTDKLTQAV